MFNIELPELSAFNFTNTTDLTSLSSVLSYTESVLISARAALTAIPQHPYDIVKLSYFNKDHEFPTIDDVKIPESISVETIQKGLERALDQHQDKVLAEMAKEDASLLNFDAYSMLSELSSNNVWVTTPEKYRKYIEFFEIMKSVDVKSLTSADIAKDVANKFSYTLLQALTQKTIPN